MGLDPATLLVACRIRNKRARARKSQWRREQTRGKIFALLSQGDELLFHRRFTALQIDNNNNNVLRAVFSLQVRVRNSKISSGCFSLRSQYVDDFFLSFNFRFQSNDRLGLHLLCAGR